MKKALSLSLILSLFSIRILSAGPFISISSIDTKSDFPRIKLAVTVIDPENRGTKGLDEENIFVYEDGYRVNYLNVRNGLSSDGGLNLVIALDSSRSISAEFLGRIKKSAQGIVDSIADKDRIALYRFNDSVDLLHNFTSNRIELLSGIRSVDRHGSKTLLYEAIYDSVALLNKSGNGRKAIVVFTDGVDEGSSLSADDAVKSAKEAGIPVYFISAADRGKIQSLARISKLTGGSFINAGCGDVSGLYKTLLSRIKNVYEIYYQSILKRDGTRHNLEVRLKYGDLKDSDSVEFYTSRYFFNFPENLFLAFVMLTVVILSTLAYLYIRFFKKGRRRYISIREENQVDPEFDGGEYNDTSFSAKIFKESRAADTAQEVTQIKAHDMMYSRVWLHLKEVHGMGRKFQMIKNEITIGSGRDNVVRIEDKAASTIHARIRKLEDGYYLYDLISAGGTFLNGKKILRPKLLHDWDEIKIGNTSLIFRGLK